MRMILTVTILQMAVMTYEDGDSDGACGNAGGSGDETLVPAVLALVGVKATVVMVVAEVVMAGVVVMSVMLVLMVIRRKCEFS